jgi:hypothetical protein
MRAPYARAIMAGQRTDVAGLPKNGTGMPRAVVQVADDPEAPALAHEIMIELRDGLRLVVACAPCPAAHTGRGPAAAQRRYRST